MNKLILIIIILVYSTNIIWAQEASIQILARPQQDKILLRWAVDQPLAWKKANQFGFLIERITISRNGEAVIPKEIEILTPDVLRPKPLMEWENLAKTNQNAAVIAQALYGDSFSVDTMNAMESIIAINQELERRFTFSLLAAEQSFEAAIMAGWGFVDDKARNGEKYAYRISVPIPEEEDLKINEGSIFSGLDMFEELPKPIGLAADFGDQSVLLSWNYSLLKETYTSYFVERSIDNKVFNRLNGAPMYNAQQAKDGENIALFYSDSISNNQKVYYRVKGISTFGEIGPPSNIIEGSANKELKFVPYISYKEIPDQNTVILTWDFPEKGNELITGFELHQSYTDEGPFKTVQENIVPTARTTTYQGLYRTNYFKIVAIGKAGVSSESFTSLVQPQDNEPPKPPIGLTGTLDTTGVVQLSWQKNTENDLLGYRIYRANNPNAEFSPISQKEVRKTNFTDTIAVKNMNKKIYYKILAEDIRYNPSEYSEVLEIEKPDMTPPSPPVIADYKVSDNKVFLTWIPSSSDDVATHSIFRKDMSNPSALWEYITEMPADTSEYTDTSAQYNANYSYTMVAKDLSGLESTPATPVTLTIGQQKITPADIKFSGLANREQRFVQLSWKIPTNEVSEYRLYKADSGSKLQLFKTFRGDVNSYRDIDVEAGSEYEYGLQLVLKGGAPSGAKKIKINY